MKHEHRCYMLEVCFYGKGQEVIRVFVKRERH